MTAPIGGTQARMALWLAAIVLLALAAERLWLIPVRLSFNANEGWNAFQATRAMGPQGLLYPPPGGLIGDNYPPLSFLIVGWTARVFGVDAIVAGRLLALASLLATSGSVAWAVRRLQPSASPAPWAAALLVLGFGATQFRAYLAMDDPQWFAHALMTPVAPLLLPSRTAEAPRPSRVVAAAALTIAGLLVKHNLLALPAAATAWLAWRHRARCVLWVSIGAALGATAAVVMVAAYGFDVFRDILAEPRHGSVTRMLRSAAGPLLASLPLIVASWGLLRLRRRDDRIELPLLFIVIAVPFGVLQRSGQGVNFNAHFEALIALAIGCGVVLSYAMAADGAAPARRIATLMILPFVALAPLAARESWRDATTLPARKVAWSDLQRRISAAPGPVACEMLALCFWAGRPFVLDTFLYGQRLAANGDESALQRALASGRITLVQREPSRPVKAGDTPNPLLARLDQGARVVFTSTDGRRLEIPRP